MRVYLDTNDDAVWENGTAISPMFNITSVNDFGMNLEVTEDMYDETTGELMVELSPDSERQVGVASGRGLTIGDFLKDARKGLND